MIVDVPKCWKRLQDQGEVMPVPDPEYQLSLGITKLNDGDSLRALVHFDKAVQAGGAPACLSYFGFCIAKERGQILKGLDFCHEALESEPGNPVHYLNIARIHLLARHREEALEALRQGTAFGPNEEVTALLEEYGERKPPPIAFLHRDHPVNKYLGIILAKLGQR